MTDPEASEIEFRLLGEVAAVRGGSVVSLGGPRQQALLALLLLEGGRRVHADRLAEELWRGRPPKGVAATLRSYVSRLRSALGDSAPITGGPSGYALDVEPAQVDLRRFEQLAAEGHEALERGAARRAAERLRAALALWSGRPFGGLADEGELRLEADRLEELRLLALEERIEADLALGKSAELVDELEVLVREHPYRERFVRHMMLALYRADRQADALAAFHRARAALDEELGLEPSDELRRLEQAILRHEVEDVTPPEERHNLPAATTSFLGRASELAEVADLLQEARLVTLTGVGGAGKTRLALEVARRALPDFPDGVFLCDLAPLHEPELVPRRVANAVGVEEQAGVQVDPLLVQQLRRSELLVVLDNCEHLLEASAELAQRLLAGCERARVLATSRTPLGLAGEVDYPVPPLALPPVDASFEELQRSEAVALFLARASEARPRLERDTDTVLTAAKICSDLDGLPLAIELAAARAKALSLQEIGRRLTDRFRFLTSWRRLTAARHQTLKEAMEWSYDLLGADERDLFTRLSVFSGGFTLQAAAGVCLDRDDSQAEPLLARLVDASLVVPEEHEGATRYHLLETVRQYAAAKLEEAGAEEEIRRRHADWCLALAEEAEPQLTGEEQTRWFATLEAEIENLRSALAYLERTGDAERCLRLTIAVSRFWYVRGHLGEARLWLEHALAGEDEERPLDLQRRALTAAAAVALLQGDYSASTGFAERALDAARGEGNELFVANALSNLGAIVLAAGDHERAGALLEEAVELARKVGDTRIAALAINNLGDLALTVGDYERAEPLFEESFALLEERGDTANLARSHFNLGAVALQLGRPEEARAHFREGIAFAEEAGDKEDLAWCLEGAAALAAADGRGEAAGILLGAAGSLLQEMEADFKPFERKLHEATETRASDACGDEAFVSAVEAGRELPLPEALVAAHEVLGTA